MTQPLKIALAGLGVVGAGTLSILSANSDMLRTRCGRSLVVTAVAARDRTKSRGVAMDGLQWFDDAARMAREADADVVVEAIGGADGIARAVAEGTLDAGRHLVTANKALIAQHGTALAEKAEAHGVSLAFEASVAGGIPVIKALREGLAGNNVRKIAGILNGTCNYILTTMRTTERAFGDVLGEAQKMGYAEADPSFDVDGIDTAHKLAILASIAFGSEVNFRAVHVEGIRHVAPVDIQFASQLGYRIKLLGIATMVDGAVEQRVHPCLVPANSPLGSVEGVFNGVSIDGDAVGTVMLEGRGAGAGPTASAVVADLVDIARGCVVPAFGLPVANLIKRPTRSMDEHTGAYYVRLMVVDRPGVFADVAAVLRDHHVSMESVLQRSRAPGDGVPLVLTTHDTREADMRHALEMIGSLDSVVEAPRVIRVEPA